MQQKAATSVAFLLYSQTLISASDADVSWAWVRSSFSPHSVKNPGESHLHLNLQWQLFIWMSFLAQEFPAELQPLSTQLSNRDLLQGGLEASDTVSQAELTLSLKLCPLVLCQSVAPPPIQDSAPETHHACVLCNPSSVIFFLLLKVSRMCLSQALFSAFLTQFRPFSSWIVLGMFLLHSAHVSFRNLCLICYFSSWNPLMVPYWPMGKIPVTLKLVPSALQCLVRSWMERDRAALSRPWQLHSPCPEPGAVLEKEAAGITHV